MKQKLIRDKEPSLIHSGKEAAKGKQKLIEGAVFDLVLQPRSVQHTLCSAKTAIVVPPLQYAFIQLTLRRAILATEVCSAHTT